MTNSADILLEFFASGWQDRPALKVTSIFHALDDLEQTLDTMETVGQNVSMFQEALPRWGSAVASNLTGEMKWSSSGWTAPHEGDIGLLRALSDRIAALSQATDDATRSKIAELVDQATRALVEDVSLPEEFRWHLAKLLLHAKSCLAEYEIRGEVDLIDAVERLVGAIRLAEEKSSDGSRWAKVWDDYGKPFVTGLFVELAGGAGLSAILAITSGAGG